MANSSSSESISVLGTDGHWHAIRDGDVILWNVDVESHEPILDIKPDEFLKVNGDHIVVDVTFTREPAPLDLLRLISLKGDVFIRMITRTGGEDGE